MIPEMCSRVVSLILVPCTSRRFSFFQSLMAAIPSSVTYSAKVEVQFHDAGQVLQLLHSLIGDPRERQIEIPSRSGN